MDAHRFDDLTRAVADPFSRRRMIRGLVAGVAGALLGARAAGAACREAGRLCSQHGSCCSGLCDPATHKCACPAGTFECRGGCTTAADLQADVNNCGGCGWRCPAVANAAATCVAGVCGFACVAGFTLCGGVCIPAGGCCVGGAAVAAGTPDPDNACRACQPANSTTAWSPRANGSPCDDGNACTITDSCQGGACTGSNPVVCAALDQCHAAGACDPSTAVCSNPNAPDGTGCNDGNPCTTGDACQAGLCAGTPVADGTGCGGGLVCAAAVCRAGCVVVGMFFLPGADNPSNACQSCQPASSVTAWTAKENGANCDDHNACTRTDTCQGGQCVGTNPVVCAAADACHHVGVCDTATGQCTNPQKADGTSCSDGNDCTQTDTCQAGACVGTAPVDCPPPDECHDAGVCNAATGQCEYEPVPDGTACTGADRCFQTYACQAGACTGGDPVVCAAADQCHDAGVCNPATGGCSDPAKADGTACDDGDATTCGDACQGGVCVGGPCGPPLAVCSPTLTCPPGLICCGSDACYDPVRCDPITGTCAQCLSACDPLGFEGFLTPILNPPCPEGGLGMTSLAACGHGTCQDNQVYCGNSGWELVDGVCRATCGFPGNFCTEVGTKCCGSQICCSTSTQRCHLGPPPQCIDTCPGGFDPCGGVCCDHFFDPDGDLVMTESCEFGVCRTKCGGTTCDRDTERCCGSRCCDKNTQVCGTAPGTCAPLPTCSSSQVYVLEDNVCCPTVFACGDPPSACCNPFTEVCDAGAGRCFPKVVVCADGRDSCGGVCCEPDTQTCVDGACRTRCFPTTCAIGSEICCGGICCDAGTEVCGPGSGTGIGTCLPR